MILDQAVGGASVLTQEIGDVYDPFLDFVAAALTGTAITATDEDDIVAGGRTIIITLTDDTWVAVGAVFDAERQAIIDGMDAAASPLLGWNDEVRDKEVVTAVVRDSDTQVTITLTASALYNIAATETITVTVPASALVTSGSPVVATPTFTVITTGIPAPSVGGEYHAGVRDILSDITRDILENVPR